MLLIEATKVRMDERQRDKPRVRTLAKRRSEAAQKITYLPEGYVPGPDDVMLGRSGESINHIGNQRFRQMVDSCVEKYVGLQKLQKTLLIDELVQRVRQKSPNGGFIKKDKMTGRFYEVGDHMAVRSLLSNTLYLIQSFFSAGKDFPSVSECFHRCNLPFQY